jgi:hypothetical protein
MRRSWLIVLFVAALPARASTQQPKNAVDSLYWLDSAWARAYLRHDVKMAERLFDDSLFVTSGPGRIKDKPGEIGDVRETPGMTLNHFRTRDVIVRAYKEAGVVMGLLDWSFTLNERVTRNYRRYTAVWIRGGPMKWKMVALHIGPAAPPPPDY